MSKTQEDLGGVSKSPPQSSLPHNIFHHYHHGTPTGETNANADADNNNTSQDPLVAFEHHLLARPPNLPVAAAATAAAAAAAPARLSARSLTVPSQHLDRHPSPSPSPDARRCMAATDAWKPRLDRRQSWDSQAYRRAMIVKATGILCGAGEVNSAAAGEHKNSSHFMGHQHCLDGHHHHGPFHHSHENNGCCNVYEVDRGFSECANGTT